MPPPYAHHAHLPYAREPWKSLYVVQRLTTTLLLVPCWALYYLVLPRTSRPRSSWSIRQVIFVNFTRRVFKVTEVAGVTWGTRDPNQEPAKGSLKETRFEWVEPLPEALRAGILVDGAPFKRVGVYIWPKNLRSIGRAHGGKDEAAFDQKLINPSSPDVELSAADIPTIGMFMHGGGYCHMSAHETSRTSRIPRRLMKDKLFTEIYSVEYRLLQTAPFPAVLQDAAAVYAHVVNRYGAGKCKIVLIGDSSGGNLVLALARWIRDEGKLPAPAGLLLLSPSCDTSHAFPQAASAYIPRPNAETDYLVDTPEPRALLQRTFLGFQYRPQRVGRDTRHAVQADEEARLLQIVHSEYVSPASPRVLERWGHPAEQRYHDVDDTVAAVVPPLAPASLPTTPGLEPPADSPYRTTSRFPALFAEFPRSLVVVGDAERLTTEVRSLVGAMERDGVDVHVQWVADAVHDILTIADGWWDKRAMEQVWGAIGEWMRGI